MRLLLFAALAIQAQPVDPWKPVQFLIGEWAAEEGNGGSSFDFDLQRKILIRKNFSPGHEDLMVIYLDPGLKAIYFDNEGHVIHYTVEAEANSVKFLSEQYRLTYRRNGEDKLTLDFDIAPPGKPFANYIHASLRKKGLQRP
jgi:hypothetical protein